MNWRGDDRAQSVQIGAILLFATLVIALSVYQATVVPSQNADVEYKHSQTVQNQMTDVRNGILRSAATGTTQPASVTLGTQYPSRVFLMNPPPATGTLSTTNPGEIRLENVAASNPETDDFFEHEGFTWNSPTKALSYEPDYNEYDNAPTLLFESSILSNYYPNRDSNPAVPLSDQLLVNEDSRTITLVALNGSVSTTRAGSVSVEPEALSAPYQSVSVEPESGNTMKLTVPTQISNETLASRTSLSPADVSAGPTPNTVNVTLTGNYTLRTAKVGVGTGATDPDEEYLTLVDSGAGNESVTVEVRDRFNNPVSGVSVTVAYSGSNPFERDSRVTGDNGRATFEAADSASGTATLEILDGATHESVNVDVESATPVGPGGSGGRLVQVGSAFAFDGQDPDTTTGGLNLTVQNTYGTDITITDVTVEPEDIDLDGLSDKAGGEGYGQSELHVESIDTAERVTTDVPLVDAEYTHVSGRGLTLSLDRAQQERIYDTNAQSYDTAETEPIGSPIELRTNERAEIAFAEFYDVGTSSASAVDVTGEQFRVTVSYTLNGNTSITDQFVVTARSSEAANGGGGGGNAQNVEIVQTQINNGQVVLQFRNNNQQSVAFSQARLVSYTENNPPNNPNRDPIDRVIYRPSFGGPELVEGDTLESVSGPTISNGGNQDVTLQPRRIDSTGGSTGPVNANAEPGDSFELTIGFDDGSTRTYSITL